MSYDGCRGPGFGRALLDLLRRALRKYYNFDAYSFLSGIPKRCKNSTTSIDNDAFRTVPRTNRVLEGWKCLVETFCRIPASALRCGVLDGN